MDLEIGTPGLPAPEVRMPLLFRDGFVGAVRAGHTLLSGLVTPERYAECGHLVASRKEEFTGPVDDTLATLGLRRRIVAVVPGFPDALQVARGTDLVALVPGPASAVFRGWQAPSVMWHPRLDANPAQRWLQGTVAEVCCALCSGLFPSVR